MSDKDALTEYDYQNTLTWDTTNTLVPVKYADAMRDELLARIAALEAEVERLTHCDHDWSPQIGGKVCRKCSRWEERT